MDRFPLRLDRYFFTQSVVQANPQHDPEGAKDGSRVEPQFSCAAVDADSRTFAVELTISLNEAESENPPYFFTISAFALLKSEQGIPQDAALALANSTGFNMLAGAVREHLASTTARGPWGPFLFGPLTLQFLPSAANGEAD